MMMNDDDDDGRSRSCESLEVTEFCGIVRLDANHPVGIEESNVAAWTRIWHITSRYTHVEAINARRLYVPHQHLLVASSVAVPASSQVRLHEVLGFRL